MNLEESAYEIEDESISSRSDIAFKSNNNENATFALAFLGEISS